jgi:hypothetical protein
MAYPYPSTEAAGSSSSLGHGTQVTHGQSHGHGPSISGGAAGYREVIRKASDGDGDVLQQLKVGDLMSSQVR